MILDIIVLVIYISGLILIGIRASKLEKSTEDFFLGGRIMPWWAVSISIYATSLSALTFIGVPGVAFSGDFHYLQLVIGDLCGRVAITYLFLKPYYKNQVTTVYELLGIRFGPRSHDAGTGFFILTRLLASGVRLAGCAIAISVIFKAPLFLSIILIALFALIYTVLGGIKAVIWTDTLQFFIFCGGAGLVLITILGSLPGGWQDFADIGRKFDKFKIFHVSLSSQSPDYWLSFSNSKSLIAGSLFGFITTFAALGTDQDLVQRMLTCPRVKDSQRALLLSALMNIPITVLFLGVGAGLFVYYHVHPEEAVTRFITENQTDKIFPYFIQTVLAPGIRGILIAGLISAAMSSLDSALNALSSTAYIDIVQRYFHPNDKGPAAVKTSRYFVIFFTLVLVGIAIVFAKTDSILWLGFRIVGYTYGGLLGIFLLAVLSKKRGNDWVNLLAMVSSVMMVWFLTAENIRSLEWIREIILYPLGIKNFSWPWAILLGTLWTFGISIAFRTKNRRNVDEEP